MSYKHNNIRNAVLQATSLHAMVAKMNDELARAREEYSPARYQVIEAEKRQEFRNALSAMSDTVHNLKRDLMADAEKKESAMLLEHGKNPYIQLIGSGAVLTADELTGVLKQNPGNPLLLRSIEAYANNHKIDAHQLNQAMQAESAAQSAHASSKKAIENLANYLTNYIPHDSVLGNTDAQKTSYEMFATLNDGENNLFEKLDSSI